MAKRKRKPKVGDLVFIDVVSSCCPGMCRITKTKDDEFGRGPRYLCHSTNQGAAWWCSDEQITSIATEDEIALYHEWKLMDFDPKVSENIDRKEDHGRDSAKVARRRKR